MIGLLILLLLGATTKYWGYDKSKTFAGKLLSFVVAVGGMFALGYLIYG